MYYSACNQISMLILDFNALVCFLHCFRWTNNLNKSSKKGLKWKWFY